MPTADGKVKVMALVPSMRTGGAERVIARLLEHLDRERFALELTIVQESEIHYAIPEDVPVHQLDDVVGADALFGPEDEIVQLFGTGASWMGAAAGRFAEVVRERQPDIVISSPLWASLLATLAYDALPGTCRLVNRVDAPPSVSLAQNSYQGLYEYILRHHFNDAARVIAVSQAVGRELVGEFGIDEARVRVVHNPVELEKIRAMSEEPVEEPLFDDGVPVVVSVGRLERVKGVEYLVRALALVLRERPARLVVVGDGSQKGYLLALAKHLGIAEHVHLVGRKNNPFKYLGRAAAFVMPSLSEGMPNVLIEAMACGCPVIATDIRGGITREVLEDGAHGLIVPLQDAEALAQAVLTMLGDDALRERFARSGLVRAEEFDLPRIIQLNQDLLLAVAAEPIPAARAGRGRPAAPPAAPASATPVVSVDSETPTDATVKPRARLFDLNAWKSRIWRLLHPDDSKATLPEAHEVVATDVPRPRVPSGKIRLAIIAPALDDQHMAEGTEVLLRHLDRDRFEVCLLRVDDRADADNLPSDVIEYRVVAQQRTGFRESAVPPEVALRNAEKFAWMSAQADGVVDALATTQVDAVLALGFYASILATMASERAVEPVAVLASMHRRAHDFPDSGSGSGPYTALIRGFFGNADAVLAPTVAIEHDLAKRFLVPAELITRLPDPVEVDSTRGVKEAQLPHPWCADGQPLFVSHVHTGKREDVNLLVAALALARRQEPVRLLILGPETLRAPVRQLAAEAGVAEAIDFVTETQPLPGLRGATAYVNAATAMERRIPHAAIEAVVDSCPVISTMSSEAAGQMFGPEARGVLVPMNDPPALADAMLQLVWDDEAGQAIADRASDYLRRVAADVVVPQYERIIEDAVKRVRERSQQA